MEKAIAECDVDMSVTRKGSLLNIHFSKEAPYDYETAYTDKKMSVAALWNLRGAQRRHFPDTPRPVRDLHSQETEVKIGKVIAGLPSLDATKPYRDIRLVLLYRLSA